MPSTVLCSTLLPVNTTNGVASTDAQLVVVSRDPCNEATNRSRCDAGSRRTTTREGQNTTDCLGSDAVSQRRLTLAQVSRTHAYLPLMRR